MSDSRAALEALASRLWDERRIVSLLLYRLTVARLLLAAEDRRFLPDALREVEQTLELLRDGEERREEALRNLAGVWYVAPDGLTLDELARRAPEPFDHTFRDHHRAFVDLAAEIDAVASHNRALARVGLGEISSTIELLTGSERPAATIYDAHGQLDPTSPVGDRIREVL